MGPGYWFDYDDRYVPAAIWAAVIVIFGAFAFLFAIKHSYRKVVLGIWLLLIAVCVGMVVAGTSRHFAQPPYVRETLLLTGFISTCLTLPAFFVIRYFYEKSSWR